MGQDKFFIAADDALASAFGGVAHKLSAQERSFADLDLTAMGDLSGDLKTVGTPTEALSAPLKERVVGSYGGHWNNG